MINDVHLLDFLWDFPLLSPHLSPCTTFLSFAFTPPSKSINARQLLWKCISCVSNFCLLLNFPWAQDQWSTFFFSGVARLSTKINQLATLGKFYFPFLCSNRSSRRCGRLLASRGGWPADNSGTSYAGLGNISKIMKRKFQQYFYGIGKSFNYSFTNVV